LVRRKTKQNKNKMQYWCTLSRKFKISRYINQFLLFFNYEIVLFSHGVIFPRSQWNIALKIEKAKFISTAVIVYRKMYMWTQWTSALCINYNRIDCYNAEQRQKSLCGDFINGKNMQLLPNRYLITIQICFSPL
jgi:hypothetical protein